MAYFIIKLTSLVGLFKVVGVICLASIGALIIFYEELGREFEKEKIKKYIKRLFYGMLIFLSLSALLPTTKQAAAIYILPNIVNNEDLKETFKQIPELSNLGLHHLKEILSDEVTGVINEVKDGK